MMIAADRDNLGMVRKRFRCDGTLPIPFRIAIHPECHNLLNRHGGSRNRVDFVLQYKGE